MQSSSYDGDIHYTFDGSDPNLNSPIFVSSIVVYERNSEPNSIADIPTNPPTISDRFVWQLPQSSIHKSRLMKAAVFKNGVKVSPVVDKEMLN